MPTENGSGRHDRFDATGRIEFSTSLHQSETFLWIEGLVPYRNIVVSMADCKDVPSRSTREVNHADAMSCSEVVGLGIHFSTVFSGLRLVR